MLGTRGCRLGILYPEIYEMQVQAILRAAKAADRPPHPEIMIPLVDYETELQIMRELVLRVAEQEEMTWGTDYTVGTTIELPAPALSHNPHRSLRPFLQLRHERSHSDSTCVSPATMLNQRSFRPTSSARSSIGVHSRRSTNQGSAGSCG